MGQPESFDGSDIFESEIDEYDSHLDRRDSDDEFYTHTLFDEYHGELSDDEDIPLSERDVGKDPRWKEEEMEDYDELED